MGEDLVDDAVSTGGVSRRIVLRGPGLAGIAAAFAAAGWVIEERAAQEGSPVSGSPLGGEPNGAVMLFGQPADPAAFDQYLWETHVPIAMQIPRLQHSTAAAVLGLALGGAASYHLVVTLRFAGRADFEAAVASREGREALADLANFATGGVTVLLVHVADVPVPGTGGTPVASPAA